MASRIFHISKEKDLRQAGATDLIELLPVPGSNPLFIPKWILEVLVFGFCRRWFIHLSGPTGGGKTALLDALALVQENFLALCTSLGFPVKPLKLFGVETALFETPGELFQRRSIKEGSTWDEPSILVQALHAAAAMADQYYPAVHLREMGRVHTSSVQGGLLNLITQGDILLPDSTRLPGSQIGWVADSNYQAEGDFNHTLVPLDDALKRRFSLNITLDYLSAEPEIQVVSQILKQQDDKKPDAEVVAKAVRLGQALRRSRAEGSLQSVPPPTISGYLAYVQLAAAMPHLTLQQVALVTLLGNAGAEDQQKIPALLNQVFGLQAEEDGELELESNLF